MALIKIEYGSVADSATLNENFNYLDERITDTAVSIATLQSNISSVGVNANAQLELKASEITTNIESMKTELDETIAGVSDVIGANGLYITTYVNGTSWYREYFSDSAKTQRVWLEQSGKCNVTWNKTTTVNLLKSFSDTNYTLLANFSHSRNTDDNLMPYIASASQIKLYVSEVGANSNSWSGQACWYVCGK